MFRVSAWTKSNTKTIVLALELIDNLPHDKIKPDKETGEVLQAELNTIMDKKKATFGDDLTEQFYPINDSLLQDVVRTMPFYVPSYYGQARWIPTVCCGLMAQLFEKRPNASLLLADFDWLPSPNLESRRSILKRKSIEAEGGELSTRLLIFTIVLCLFLLFGIYLCIFSVILSYYSFISLVDRIIFIM